MTKSKKGGFIPALLLGALGTLGIQKLTSKAKKQIEQAVQQVQEKAVEGAGLKKKKRTKKGGMIRVPREEKKFKKEHLPEMILNDDGSYWESGQYADTHNDLMSQSMYLQNRPPLPKGYKNYVNYATGSPSSKFDDEPLTDSVVHNKKGTGARKRRTVKRGKGEGEPRTTPVYTNIRSMRGKKINEISPLQLAEIKMDKIYAQRESNLNSIKNEAKQKKDIQKDVDSVVYKSDGIFRTRKN